MDFFKSLIDFVKGKHVEVTQQQLKAIIGGKEYPNLFRSPTHLGWQLLIGKYRIQIDEKRINYDRDYTVALLYILDHTNNYQRILDAQLLRASIIEISDDNLKAVEITEELLNEIQEEQRRKGNQPLP